MRPKYVKRSLGSTPSTPRCALAKHFGCLENAIFTLEVFRITLIVADVEIFQAFAGYAAVSLRNARLFRMAEMEQRKSVSMLQLAHNLAAEALDEARLAKAVVGHVWSSFHFEVDGNSGGKYTCSSNLKLRNQILT